jgi:hypothetical protein
MSERPMAASNEIKCHKTRSEDSVDLYEHMASVEDKLHTMYWTW